MMPAHDTGHRHQWFLFSYFSLVDVMSFSSEDFHVIAEPFLVPLATSGRFSAAGTFSAAIAASRSAAAAFWAFSRLERCGQFGLHTTQPQWMAVSSVRTSP